VGLAGLELRGSPTKVASYTARTWIRLEVKFKKKVNIQQARMTWGIQGGKPTGLRTSGPRGLVGLAPRTSGARTSEPEDQ
jgi:hypothetical protein